MGVRLITPIAVGLVFVAIILQIVGVVTPQWVSLMGSEAYFGLWRYCIQLPGQKQECHNFPSDVSSWLKAVRALGIVAPLFMAGTVASGILSAVKPNNVSASRLSTVLAFVGGASALVSASIFAGKCNEITKELSFNDYNYDYSFYLCIAAGIVIVIPAVMFRLALRWNVYAA